MEVSTKAMMDTIADVGFTREAGGVAGGAGAAGRLGSPESYHRLACQPPTGQYRERGGFVPVVVAPECRLFRGAGGGPDGDRTGPCSSTARWTARRWGGFFRLWRGDDGDGCDGFDEHGAAGRRVSGATLTRAISTCSGDARALWKILWRNAKRLEFQWPGRRGARCLGAAQLGFSRGILPGPGGRRGRASTHPGYGYRVESGASGMTDRAEKGACGGRGQGCRG